MMTREAQATGDAPQSLTELLREGLSALRAGGRIAQQATSEIQNDASDPELRNALEQSSRTAHSWSERIDQAIEEVGEGEENDNPVIKAHYEVSRKIRARAPGPAARDLGIIANGQLALHYWIASFGAMRNYAAHLGHQKTEQAVRACLDEAK